MDELPRTEDFLELNEGDSKVNSLREGEDLDSEGIFLVAKAPERIFTSSRSNSFEIVIGVKISFNHSSGAEEGGRELSLVEIGEARKEEETVAAGALELDDTESEAGVSSSFISKLFRGANEGNLAALTAEEESSSEEA